MTIKETLTAKLTSNINDNIKIVFDFLDSQKNEETYQESLDCAREIFDSLTQPKLTQTDNPSMIRLEKKKAFDSFLYILKTYIDRHYLEEALLFAQKGENKVKKEMKRICKEHNDNSIVFRFCYSAMEYSLVDQFFACDNDDILSLDYVSLLVLQAQANFYLHRLDEAKALFRKALDYDPVSPELAFFIADIDIHNNNWISYTMDLDKVYEFCYKLPDLKRYYRYLARYYKEYRKDMDLYKILNLFGDFKKGTPRNVYASLTEEEKAKVLEEKIPIDISDEVLSTLIIDCKNALHMDNIPMYKYFFNILKEYRNDKEIEELLHAQDKTKTSDPE